MASREELSAFLASVERRAFKQAQFAVRDADAALDIVQDAMMKLAENYGDRPGGRVAAAFHAHTAERDPRSFPAAEGPLDLGYAVLGIDARPTTTTPTRSKLLRPMPGPSRRRVRADKVERDTGGGHHRGRGRPASGPSTGGIPDALLGRYGRGGNRRSHGVLARAASKPTVRARPMRWPQALRARGITL